MPQGDITEEFRQWAEGKRRPVTDDNFYDLWAQFLEDEYNDQRKNPQDYI